MIEIVCQKLFGYVPESINFDWHPLRMMTNEQESLGKTQELDRITKLKQMRIASDATIAEMINSANIFNTEVSEVEAQELDDVSDEDGPVAE